MKPCSRVGIDVTWRCQWKCATCFYLRNPLFHRPIDVPFEKIVAKIDRAKIGGLDHVVLVGYGEPALYPKLSALLDYAHSCGMATSMITNGAVRLSVYQDCFAQGLDHLHISSHGIGDTLDKIADSPGAFRRQTKLKEWLREEKLPFRTNVTMQQLNYRELVRLAERELLFGVYHFVFLGFLPHYEWHDYVSDVAVHPAELRPFIEDAADILLENNTHFTIRYHPLCHLSPRYWPYVTNARYVLFDPGEWNYSLQVHDIESLWADSVACGESVSCNYPCKQCIAYWHCGGWNRVMANAFPNCLSPIREIPIQYQHIWNRRGGLHDLNPFNALSCTLRGEQEAK